jgi:hypothetical protein
VQDDAQLLFHGPAARERALDDAQRLGADAVRLLARWRRPVEEIDPAVRGILARGLTVILVPTGPAPDAHARCRRRDLPPGVCRPDPAAYGRFVERLGRRFPDVRSWAIWNEPNNGAWLGPQRGTDGRPVSPALYRSLVRAGAAALRRTGHGRDELLIGETAAVPDLSVERPGLGPMSPGRFIDALLCCGTLPGTGWGHHAYSRGGSRSPFERSAPGVFGPSGLGALRRLVDLPLHITEAGVQTSPPDRLLGMPISEQAAALDGFERLASAHAKSSAQYLLVDERRPGAFQSGLRFADGRPKPALSSFATPAWRTCRGRAAGRLRGQGSGVAVVVEVLREGRWRRWSATRTRTRGVVRSAAPGGRAWRLRWEGGTSRVVRPGESGPRCR